ncbi:cytochrome c oxidase, cbb3-type, subunit III [compost metagenome]
MEEYAIEVQKGEAAKLAYLASAANNVDENTVTTLTDAADIEAGKTVFVQVCAACHGADGGGSVGPNLTDDYWLHGGGIKDIFRTITVGVQDKGMKSWKEDYSPKQIQQIASYIKTLHGTKPSTPKASQGELYIEEIKENSTQATAAHGTAAAADSTSAQ